MGAGLLLSQNTVNLNLRDLSEFTESGPGGDNGTLTLWQMGSSGLLNLLYAQCVFNFLARVLRND